MAMPRTIVFVDGENLVFRYQAMVDRGESPSRKVVHIPDVFVWHPQLTTWSDMDIFRVYYYTSVVGDDRKLVDVREQIAKTVYSYEYEEGQIGNAQLVPIVFKKAANSRKTRQVDIQITIDMMRSAHQHGVNLLYLISGDGDYLPLIAEVMRHGKELYVGALSSGLHPELPYSVDDFQNLDGFFFRKPRKPKNKIPTQKVL